MPGRAPPPRAAAGTTATTAGATATARQDRRRGHRGCRQDRRRASDLRPGRLSRRSRRRAGRRRRPGRTGDRQLAVAACCSGSAAVRPGGAARDAGRQCVPPGVRPDARWPGLSARRAQPSRARPGCPAAGHGGAAPMPVAVELKGLLPGRGPAADMPLTGRRRRARPGPPRGAAGPGGRPASESGRLAGLVSAGGTCGPDRPGQAGTAR